MKRIAVFLFLLAAGTQLEAQPMDTVVISHKARKFKASEHFLMRFETLDTLDELGNTITMTRSYYFDKKNRMISSVRESYNPKKPEKGMQVIYSFARNQLNTVSVIPPKSACTNCASHYHYAGDTVLARQEGVYTKLDPETFLRQAHRFQATFSPFLPWGYFEDEVLVDGKMKRLRRVD